MPDSVRIDKWLFFARFFKSRSLAAARAESGDLWVNGRQVTKAAHEVKPGDRLEFSTGPRLRRVTVLALAEARRPAPEARRLYHEEDSP